MYRFINYKKVNKLFLITFVILSICNLSYSNIVEELTALNNLYKEGAITKEEFSKAKSLILKSDKKKIIELKNEIEINEDPNQKNISSKMKKNQDKEKDVLLEKTKKIKDLNENLDLTNTYVSLEEFNQLGTYVKINEYPKGLFKVVGSQKNTAKDAMIKMYQTFVQKPKLLEKYPENMMKAMAYFEVFYNYELKDKEKSIEKFKKNYPNINWKTKKDIKTLYSLNNAKKSMREAMSLNQENSLNEALDRYMFMYKFLKPAKKITHKLSSVEKKLKHENSKFKKHYGNLKKTLSEKSENRIGEKDFKKQLNKNIKKVEKSFKNFSKLDHKHKELYSSINNVFLKSMDYYNNCAPNCSAKELNIIIDSIKVNLSILKEFEPIVIKKRYSQNMDVLNLDNLADEEQATLALITSKLKLKKKTEAIEVQEALFNMETNGFDLDEELNKLGNNGFVVKSIAMSYDTLDKMKLWAMNDWANSWRGELPTDLKDSSGNIIEFTDENIKDIKAQLAYNSFNSLIDNNSLKSLVNNSDLKNAIKENINENIQEIAQEIKDSNAFDVDSWLSQDFSISLNNYSQLVGNSLGIELNNFDDLTQTVNEMYGTNMSSEEYAASWESSQYLEGTSTWGDVTRGVDLINQLGSFDAASIAKDLGADLSTVADSIVAAANVGVSTDLEAAAQGLGYSSFADAVKAYNEQYGTNYTVDSAKEALGQ